MKRHQLIFLLSFICTQLVSKLEAIPSRRNPGARIIGGEEAWAGQFPFAAAITAQTSNSRIFCGGALTGNDWVITAGHCVYNAILFTVQLGSIHLESEDQGGLVVATSTYILHPDFNPDTIENDIGVIQFRRPIDYNTYLNPVFPYENPVNDYASVYALGWGQTSDTDDTFSNQLRFIFVTTISNLECKMVYGDAVTDNMVCIAGNYNQGTCIGDNGSPLVGTLGKAYILVGIASFVSGNGCESTDPSGYTRTHPYYDWIRNFTTVA